MIRKVILVILVLSNIKCEIRHAERDYNDFKFLEYDILKMHEGYIKKDFKIIDVANAYVSRINSIDFSGPKLNSIIQINPDIFKLAKELDKELVSGNIRGPLHGIPILIKDNINTGDKMFTTAGSLALKNSQAKTDSYIVRKLRESGALILGKSNLSEWANFRGQNSSSGWSGINGQTKNPYVLSRNPCGSSSGSGVAVAANLTMLAIGTETNGSIICPSNNNGIVGIKPTVGLLSREGIIPISYTQDTPGPMSRNLTDAVIALGVMTGIDKNDPKTKLSDGKYLKDYTKFLKIGGAKGKKIGVYSLPLKDKSRRRGYSQEVDTLFKRSLKTLKSLGAELVELDTINHRDLGLNSYKVMLYEFKDGVNKYLKTLRDNVIVNSLNDVIEFNKNDSVELKFFNQYYLEQANKTEGIDSPEYNKSLANLNVMSKDLGIDRVMKKYDLDAIVSPSGGPAWKTDPIYGDNYHIGSSSPAARAGYPNVTIPMGDINGLPVGISFFGMSWTEPELIEIAYDYEQKTKKRIIPKFRKNIK